MSNSCSILLCSKHIQPTAINHAHPTLTDKCLCTLSVSDQTPLIFTLKTFVPTTDVYNLSWKFWAHWSSIWRKTCVLALYFLLLSNSMLYQIQRMQWFHNINIHPFYILSGLHSCRLIRPYILPHCSTELAKSTTFEHLIVLADPMPSTTGQAPDWRLLRTKGQTLCQLSGLYWCQLKH